MGSFNLKVVTPEGVLYEKPVKLLKVNTPLGYVVILPRHMSYITPVNEGFMDIQGEKEARVQYKVSKGLLYVEKTHTTLLLEAPAEKV